MKKGFSTWLTVALAVVLVIGAVCIGGVKGYREEREELLLACMASHAEASNMARSIQACETAVADFDARLAHQLMGKAARTFGVDPIGDQVKGLHAQLLRDADAQADAPSLTQQFEDLLDDHVDTTLSFGKIVWTCILLSVIFGKKGRKKGFTLGKLLAGFGLFKMWRKD